MTTADLATRLLALHTDPALLTLVNVWDVASARVVAQTEGTRAIATASHAIAAMYGYEDGEQIPRDLMLEAVGRVVDAVDLPVTADLEAGYGDAAETVRRAIALGVAGCNIEDQLRPVGDAAAVVEAVMRAAAAEGVPDFVLNARTDAFLASAGKDPGDVLGDAIARGRAFLDAGAPLVFVPGRLTEEQVRALVDAFGPQRLPGQPAPLPPGGARRGAGQLRPLPPAGRDDRVAGDGRGRRSGRGRPGGHAGADLGARLGRPPGGVLPRRLVGWRSWTTR
jgi:2-methylisocitrate lyase-like PEP mutase family enzyme